MQVCSSTEQRIVSSVVILSAITSPVWVYWLFFANLSRVFPGEYPYAAGLVLIPLLVLINAGVVAWVSRQDELLAKLLPVGFLLKLAATGTYLLLAAHVQNGGGDVLAYHQFGSQIASDFLITKDWASFTVSRSGGMGTTLFIYDLTGLLYTVTGPSLGAGSVVFSIIGFWGQYFGYRAFTLACPYGKRSRAALLFFLLPSSVFWTATIGKDAIIGFSICLSAYGFARLVRMPGIRAYVYLAIGLLGAWLVRPHVAALVAIAFTAAYIFGRNVRGLFGVAVKIVTVPVLVYATIRLFTQAQRFLLAENFSRALRAVDRVSYNTNAGGSAINAPSHSLLFRMATGPFLLFRPLPWEVNSLQVAIAAAETLLLLWLFWAFRAHLKAAVRRWRTDPFLLFVFIYTIGFSVIFAGAFSNIGLIVRQRAMMLPFVLMLLCYSPVPYLAEALPKTLRLRPRYRFQSSNIPARIERIDVR